MANPNEEVLEFSVAVDIRNALKEMTRVQAQMAKLTKEILKSSGRTSKEQTKNTKKTKQQTKEVRDSVDDLADSYEKEGKQVSNLARVIEALEKRVQKLQGTERDAAEQRLKALKEEEAKRAEAEAEAEKRDKKRRKPKKPPDYGFNRKNIKKFKAEFKELGSALKEPLQAFVQRDLKGLLEGSMKGAGATLGRSLKLSKFLGGAGGQALSKRGEQLAFKGKQMGGGRGALLEARGAGMKQMGAMMGKIGGVMGSLAKLGPILGMASGAMMALVKLFLDADAAVKDFNKGIMDSAGNLSLFERSGRDVNATGLRLESTLGELRDAAFDYTTNLALGITKDDHMAMVNVLTQEGVSLGRIQDEAENAGKSVRELATQFTVTGVAYSRAFGVSLAEVGQFQAEMMSEMGRSADETQKAFALMARGAAESGIASNKFFASIRAISPDLGLFNSRLEDSVAVLSKISKVMSPRNAQKFMQEAVSGLKTMGRQEKLRLSMFAGSGKTKDIVNRDIKRKTEALVNSIAEKTGEKADDLRSAFEKQGYAGIKSSIDKLGPEVSGTLAESALDLQLQKKQASQGQYGTAMATADLGIGGSLEIQQRAIMSLAGGYKSINEAIGSMDLEAVAEALGKSDEQVKQMAKLELAIDAQRQDLIAKGAKASDVNKMGYDEIIESMTKEMKESLKADGEGLSMDKKMEALAQQQGSLTQSILAKFEVLLDWLMNRFYGLMMGIWETILDFPFVSNKSARAQVHAIRGAQAGGSSELSGIASKGGDLGKGLAESNVMQSLLKALNSRGGMDVDQAQSVSELIGEMTRNMDPKDLASALEMDTGFKFGDTIGGRKKRTEFRENVGKYGYEGAATRAGATPEQAAAGLGKLAYTQGGTQEKFENLGRVEKKLKGMGLLGGGAGGVAAAPSSPAAATAEATTKTNEQLATVVDASKKQESLLKTQGIKIAPVTLKEEAKGMEASMLSALRTALFEFYLYSGTDRSTLLGAMKTGGVTDPRQMAPYFAGKSLESGGTHGAVGGLMAGEAKPNAAGGMVTGVANGMAVVASHGEGLASVGRGERIVPAGGGGSSGVHVSVNGIGGQDLARMIEGKVVEGIREYKRRERLY
jgi:hypothetical protein